MWIENEDSNKGTFYTLGEENDIKIAYLQDMSGKVLLTGTGRGTMNYTASLFDAGYEIQRVFFRNVPITTSTKIHADAWKGEELRLQIDVDGDGNIDKTLAPTHTYKGTDLQEEIYDDVDAYSNYGLIAKSKILPINLASHNLKITSNISSQGRLNVTSSHLEAEGIYNVSSYWLNGQKQILDVYPIQDHAEEELKAFVDETMDTHKDIPGGKVIGSTCFVSKENYPISASFGVEGNLVFTAKNLTTTKPVILYAKEGSITITSSKIDVEGVIYAPKGIVTLTGEEVNFNGMIIAQGINITGTKTVVNNDLNLGRIGEE